MYWNLSQNLQNGLINSFVIVEKVIDSLNAHSPHHTIKKSIRLCINPKDLNEALEREPYYSRTIDELISMFAGAKVFTIIDMDKGYWQVKGTTSRFKEIDLHGI